MPSKQRISVLCLWVGGTLSESLASTKSDAKEGDIGEYISWSSDGIIVEENVFVSLSVGELGRDVAI